MSEANLALARRWFDEVWNRRRTETIDELLTAESVQLGEGGPVRGPDGFRRHSYEPMIALFPDVRVEIEEAVAAGDAVVVRWRATGTHTGGTPDLPATGRPISAHGITWMRFAGGKLVAGWDAWNVGGLMASLRS